MKRSIIFIAFGILSFNSLFSQGTDLCDYSTSNNELMNGVTTNADNSAAPDGTIWFYYTVPSDGFTHDITITLTPMGLASATILNFNGIDADGDGDFCNDAMTPSGLTMEIVSGLCAGATLVIETGDATPALGTYDLLINDSQSGPMPVPNPTFVESSGNTPNDGIVCEGDAIDLEENSGFSTVEWFDPSNASQGNSNPFNIASADPLLHDGMWTVEVTDAGGCTASAMFMVTVNNNPTPNPTFVESSGNTSNDGIVCEGDAIDLEENSGFTSVEWFDPSNASQGNSNPFNIASADPLIHDGMWTIEVTDVNGCTASSMFMVSVNANPTPNPTFVESSGNTSNDGIVCEGDALDLEENSGFTSVDWFDPSNTFQGMTNPFSIASADPLLHDGMWTIEVTDGNGCTASSMFMVSVNSLPVAVPTVSETSGLASDDGIVCEGEAFDLEENSGFVSVEWFDPSNASQGNSNPFNIASADPLLHDGIWTVEVTDINGCTDSETILITVNNEPIPDPTFVETSGTTDNDGVVCEGDAIDFEENSGFTSVEWFAPSNSSQGMANPFSIVMADPLIHDGMWTVEVTDINGCTASSMFMVTVGSLPVPTPTFVETSGLFDNDGIACENDMMDLEENSGFTSAEWFDPLNTSQGMSNPLNIAALDPSIHDGIWSIIVTDLNGCTASSDFTVLVNTAPLSTADILNNPICPSEDLELDEIGGDAVSWLWTTNGAASFNDDMIQNPTASSVTDGEIFTVEVTDANGCTSSSDVTAMVEPPAPNDDCASPISINQGSNPGLNNDCSTFDQSVGTCSAPVDEATVWYSYTVSMDLGDVTFNLSSGTISNPAMAVYDICGGTALGEICSDGDVIVDCPKMGDILLIQVGSEFVNLGDFTITVTENAGSVSNDDCSNADPISITGVCEIIPVSTDNTGACPESFTLCNMDSNPTVWMSFMTTANTTSVDLNNIIGQIILFSDCPGVTSVSGCLSTDTNLPLLPSTNYYVAATIPGGGEGPISFDLIINETPVNDDCANAMALSLGANGGLNNTCANTNPLGSCSAPQDEATVWYSYTLAASTGTLSFDLTAGSITSPGIVVYDACSGMLVGEDCGGDLVELNCPAAGTYIIQIGSANSNTGDFDINISETPSPAPNDECNNAIDITPSAVCVFEAVSGDNIGACPETFSNCAADTNPVVWYSVTTGANTTSIVVENSVSSEEYIVADACPPSTVNCYVDKFNHPVMPNTTYYIGVHLGGGTEGAISFDIKLSEDIANDDPCGGMITVGGAVGDDNTCATSDIAFCAPSDENTLYYEYTMTMDADLEITVLGLAGVGIAAFDADPCMGTPISTECSSGSLLIKCLMTGDTYYFAVGSSAANAGTFDVVFKELVGGGGGGPSNDDCINAIDITPVVNCEFEPVTGDNTDACPEGFSNCDASAFPTIWYTFTTGAGTSSVDFDNFGGAEQIVVVDACVPTMASCFTAAPANFVTAANTTYYVAVNLAGSAEGPISFDIRFNEGPPNETSCNAFDITGGPQNGNNCCAGGGDWLFSGCPDGDEAANWFVYTPSPTADGVEITVTNVSLSGNVGVELFLGDCMTMTALGAASCGGLGASVTLEASCLTGEDIYVKVGSTSAGCGDFTVEATETSVGCNDNDNCDDIGPAETMSPLTNGGEVCAGACTTAACDDNCSSNSVWFQVNTDIDASVLEVSIDGPFTASIGIYEGSCGALNTVFPCTPGNTAITAVVSNFTYFIEVGVAGGDPDDFTICVETFQNVVDCAISAELVPTRPEYPMENPNGPYCPGEKVNFCYDVTFNIDPIGSGNNCQWLQGILPTFGGGWDIASCPPWTNGPSGSTYFPEGSVNYLVNNPILGTISTPHGLGLEFGGSGLTPGTPLPQGWWFISNGGSGCTNNGNPNTMWGLPGSCGGSSQVNFCFDLLVADIMDPSACNDPVLSDMSVDIFTFADGETGCWSSAVCALDVPALFTGLLDCSSQTEVIAEDTEICSGEFLNLMVAPNDGISDVIVEVIPNGNVSGESVSLFFPGGSGGIIADQLTNNGTNKEIVIYQMWAQTPGSVCKGPLLEVEVTVYPDILIEFDEPYILCFDDQIEITPTVTGGDCGPYNYQWEDGTTGSSVLIPTIPGSDPPGIYQMFVTVTDNFGCEGIDVFTFEIVQPIIPTVTPSPLVLCRDGVPDGIELTANFLDVGTGPYTYQWFPNGVNTNSTNGPSMEILEEITLPGVYNVDLIITDSYGCPYYVTTEVTISGAEPLYAQMDYCDYTVFEFTSGTESGASADLSVCDINGDLINGPIFSNSITTSVSSPGIFFIKSVNPATGCSTSFEFEIFPPIDPIIDISPTGPYCVGEDVNIEISNYTGNFYLAEWFIGSSNSVTGSSFTISSIQDLVQGGVLVYDENLCITFHDIELEVIPLPDVEITGSTTFCPGTSTTLSVDSLMGYTFNWTSPLANSFTSSTIDANEVGNWFVTVTNAEGCEGVAAVLVTEDNVLTPQISGDTLCTGGMISLNAGAGFSSYQWSNSAGIINGATMQTLDVTVGGLYSVDVIQGGCTGNGAYQVFEFAAPDAGPDLTEDICNADTGNGPDSLNLYSLVDTNLVNGKWLTLSGLQQDVVYFTGDTPGTLDSFYFITEEARGTCVEDTALLQVTVIDCECPLPDIGTPPNFCAETDTFNLNLIQFTPDTGTWSLVQAGPTINAMNQLIIDNGSPAGIYELVYTLDNPGGGTCETADTVIFSVFSPPTVEINMNVSVCNIDVGLGPDFIDLDDLVISGTGVWSTNSSFVIDPSTNLVDFNGATPGNYNFTFTSNNAMAPCGQVFETVAIRVIDCNCSPLSLLSLPDLCNTSDPIVMVDSLINPDALMGMWSVIPNITSVNGGLFDPTGLPEDVYTVSFSVSNPQGGMCTDIVSQTINVFDAPAAEIVRDTFACNSTTTGTYPTSLDLMGMIISGDTDGTWTVSSNYNGGVIADVNNVDFVGLIPSSYIFTYSLTGQSPCPNEAYTLVVNLQNCDCPIIQFNAIPDLCNDDSILDLDILLGSVTNPDEGSWSFVNGPENIILNGSSFDASGVALGDYTFSFTFDSVPLGCDDSRDLMITVHEPPNLNITPTGNACNTMSIQGPTVIDLGSFINGAFGSWTAPPNYNGGVLADPSNVDFDGVTPGDYVFVFTSNEANPPCVDRAYDVTITVNDCGCQIISFNPIPELCNDSGSVDLDDLLDMPTAVDGSWSFTNGPQNITLNGSLFDASGIDSGDYEFTFTLDNVALGCPESNNLIITIHPAPTITVTPIVTVCNTQSIQGPTFIDLNTLVIGDQGTWSAPNDYNGGVIVDISNVDFDGFAAGTSFNFNYTTNTAIPPCRDVFANLRVDVINCECPNLSILDPAEVCNSGGILDLSSLETAGIEAGSWSINGPQSIFISNNNTIDYTGIQEGAYTLVYTPSVTPPDDCPQFSEVILNVYNIQTLGTPRDENICEGESVLFRLSDLIPGSDPLGMWIETSAVLSTGNAFDAISGTFNSDGQVPGDYNFTYGFDNSGNPCADVSGTVSITIETVPVADAGNDFVRNCGDTDTVLGGANSSSGPNISYYWEELGGVVITNPNQATIPASTDGVYILTVTNDSNGCFDIDTVLITTDPNSLSFVASSEDSPCFGYNQGSITIDEINGAVPPIMISLDGGSTFGIVNAGDTFDNLAPGEYNIIMMDDIDCRAEKSLIIIEPEAWSVDTGDDIEIILGDSYDLSFTPSIDVNQVSNIVWTANGEIICEGDINSCNDISVTPEELTEYCVIATDLNGCIAEDCQILRARAIKDIYIPTVFSPNDDGTNDFFWIQTDQAVDLMEIYIFDRWGESLFVNKEADINDPRSFWDGRFNDQKVQPGVYVYMLKYRYAGDNESEIIITAGDITVIR